nr:hypothetical protein [Paenibacillus artemisiicola]
MQQLRREMQREPLVGVVAFDADAVEDVRRDEQEAARLRREPPAFDEIADAARDQVEHFVVVMAVQVVAGRSSDVDAMMIEHGVRADAADFHRFIPSGSPSV